MSRGILSRLDRLEAAASTSKGARPWHRIIACSHEEAEAKHSALVASGQLSKDDNAVYRIITGVPRSQKGIAR
ncbi:hypothetical protein DC522_28320 [Microvirga sp. KLBC 81]|uniref:hypothetical protein n=1 Tax=Microvirga sp. KLBC 81 TaxID=1862707 RepID=UPI000D513B44|nr:hypothetical protein [Microvirga sp. KLBC 81]PVE21130.1 hypothetical protein DC522_28320 [Microvirga sp. KLBC 81]